MKVSVRLVSTLVAVVTLAITACAGALPSREMAQKLHDGCRDEASCQALVGDGRTFYKTCRSEKARISAIRSGSSAADSFGLGFNPSRYDNEDCDKLRSQWGDAVGKYQARVMEPRAQACFDTRAPKGDAAWNRCLEARNAILAFLKENEGAGYDSHNAGNLANEVCNRACSFGAHEECCRVVNRAVETAVAARQARDCPLNCAMAAPVPSWCPHGCMTVESSDPPQCIEACRQQTLCLQGCK
jgi:hypothetical protein